MSNRNSIIFKAGIIAFILGCGVFLLAYSQMKSARTSKVEKEAQTTITYCNLKLSEGWKLGNLTFNSLYSFRINEKGEVIEVKKIRDDFIGEEEVKSCVSKWKIVGVPCDSPFVVSFNWKHGKGWVEQRISGNGFTQIMSMEGVGY
jgi:hypothetical protein